MKEGNSWHILPAASSDDTTNLHNINAMASVQLQIAASYLNCLLDILPTKNLQNAIC
jgi:hypothetical protein